MSSVIIIISLICNEFISDTDSKSCVLEMNYVVLKADGYDGVQMFKAKISEYHMKEFGTQHVGSYDPFRLVIWEDAAEQMLNAYWRD